MRTITKTLADGHVPFGVLTRSNLDQLRACQIVVIPDLEMIDEQEIDALRGYLRTGGRLYVSGNTSLLDKDGHRQDDFLLGDVLGVSRTGDTVERVTYLIPASGAEEYFQPFSRVSPLSLNTRQVRVRAGEAVRVLAAVTLPHLDADRPERFSSTLSNPPQIETADPALTVHEWETGRAMYAAGPIGG